MDITISCKYYKNDSREGNTEIHIFDTIIIKIMFMMMIKKILRRPRNVHALAVMGVFVVLGVSLLIKSHAATTFISVEAESGTVTGPATIKNGEFASGGKFIQFGAGGTVTKDPSIGNTMVWGTDAIAGQANVKAGQIVLNGE